MKLRPFLPLCAVFAVAIPAQEPNAEQAPVDSAPAESQADDPFAAASGYTSHLSRIPVARLGEPRDTLALRLEVWEVATKDWVVAMDAMSKPEHLAHWRRDRLADGTPLMHAPVLVVEAKSRNITESIIEKIYPTEYEPPEILPPAVAEEALRQNAPKSVEDFITRFTSGATPTSFETRNTGATLEAEIQPVTIGEGSWDLSIAFEDVVLAKMDTFSPEALGVTMPQFHSFRAGGLVRVQEGHWQLLSSAAPPAAADAVRSWVVLVRVDRAR
jgi:hypothetical protein